VTFKHNSLEISVNEASELFSGLLQFQSICVGVSGGRDSMCLLRLLKRWKKLNIEAPKIIAVSIDHALRKESESECKLVKSWCNELGIEHHTLNWEGIKPSTSVQQKAREARYKLLIDFCNQNKIKALVMAHHLEDQVETFFMRLARGSGIDGLRSMQYCRVQSGVDIIRPLLSIKKSRLLETLINFDQKWIDDPSNLDERYERVRVRKYIENLNDIDIDLKNISKSITRLTRSQIALELMSLKIFNDISSIDNAGYVSIDNAKLLVCNEEIQLRILQMSLNTVSGNRHISLNSLENIIRRIQDSNLNITLSGCRVIKNKKDIVIFRENRNLPRIIIAPGDEIIWDNRFIVNLDKEESSLELEAIGNYAINAEAIKKTNLINIPKNALLTLPAGFRDGRLVLLPNIPNIYKGSKLNACFLYHYKH
jgi:tRNA(Ile)-lysidine synthase